ncbi:hypothetical protein [Parasphingopyxis marina]|uniref:DUF2946 domain-containing protein n=1 Tax=Parasphingopyxis marina TaxID=2761622 RepID=A0A842HS26_9SPHN|nr:hypothetical protein [Parasphingopyxis marina]MBC2776638.1 hypothetical protein [Parasphingopyxis marina]
MHRGSAFRYLVALFVAMALLSKIAVPAGWMPVNDDGVTRITLCTGYGIADAWIDENGNLHRENPQEGGHDRGDQPCSFAAAATPFDGGPATPELAAPVADGFPDPLDRSTLIPGRGLAAPPPPATGPPLLA